MVGGQRTASAWNRAETQPPKKPGCARSQSRAVSFGARGAPSPWFCSAVQVGWEQLVLWTPRGAEAASPEGTLQTACCPAGLSWGGGRECPREADVRDGLLGPILWPGPGILGVSGTKGQCAPGRGITGTLVHQSCDESTHPHWPGEGVSLRAQPPRAELS